MSDFLDNDGGQEVAADGGSYARDLFGLPLDQAGRKRGRPKHAPTAENRRKIEAVFATMGTIQQAADACAISVNTLKRHYRDLCDHYLTAKIRLQAEMMAHLIRQAETNPAAADTVLKRIDKAQMQMRVAAPKAEKLGKKDAARAAAQESGTSGGWADDWRSVKH